MAKKKETVEMFKLGKVENFQQIDIEKNRVIAHVENSKDILEVNKSKIVNTVKLYTDKITKENNMIMNVALINNAANRLNHYLENMNNSHETE